ncbi:hypothetical protein C7H19_08300 [Aphanothece hegewaldii CCALA 016]|uniref:Uncharacterized protein n=1 Tax=Aphanothece hegewaldii CCALA 016 TaxID=2107694 RepID=A0A2T1M052_9CHRO|nr:hypothetical protein [Aphanothece hegewaldii]PSF37965.1 hypothetical protein C7H19_08300 [Aphanothece hegewaldii CCALA 016]
MPKKWITFLLIVGSFFFITVGDRFLPKPLNAYSLQTRQTLNQMILGLFPDKNPERPSKEREKEVNEFLRRASPKN